MWTVTVYRDNGYSQENYSKQFDDEDDAYDFFYEEVKAEHEDEIEKGLLKDQELQSIVDQGIYIYESDAYDVTISYEYVVDPEEYNDDFV